MSSAYLSVMFTRMITLFAMLAIAVVTTMSAAHAARMGVSMQSDHATHAGMMVQTEDRSAPRSAPSCDGDQGCGAADARACAALCAGVVAFAPAPCATPDRADPAMRHAMPAMAPPTGRAPDLAKRPPKTRLL